jgi:hypothetical protein
MAEYELILRCMSCIAMGLVRLVAAEIRASYLVAPWRQFEEATTESGVDEDADLFGRKQWSLLYMLRKSAA